MGLYDIISAEIAREQTLGNLANVPFIQAYRQVGDRLHAQGKLAPPTAETPAPAVVPQQAPEPVAAPAPKPVASRPSSAPSAPNGAAAKAASPSRTSPKPAASSFDPTEMTDEQILAATSPRF